MRNIKRKKKRENKEKKKKKKFIYVVETKAFGEIKISKPSLLTLIR